MFTISKRLVYLASFLIFVPIFFFGFYGYYLLNSINNQNNPVFKFYAEHFIYITLISVLYLAVILIFILLRSRRILRELDKIIELSQLGNHQTTNYLSRLGKLGEKINTLTFHLNKLNEMRALKISAMGKLNDFLVENMEMKVLILTPLGEITQCSKRILTKLETDKNSLAGKNIDAILTNLNWNELIPELERTRKSVVKKDLEFKDPFKKLKSDCIFYPTFNSKNDLSNVLCLLEEEEMTVELSKKIGQIKTENEKKSSKIINSIIKKAESLTKG